MLSMLIIAMGINANRQYRSRAITDFQENQFILANGASSWIESRIANLTTQLEMLALSSQVQDVDSPGCRDALLRFYYSNREFVYAGDRIDKQGRIVNMFPLDKNAINADISKQEHMRELFQEQRTVISGRFHAVEGFDAVAIHVPVFKKGKFDGSVATVVKISQLADSSIKPISTNRGGIGWMTDDKGVIAFYPDQNLVNRPLARTDFLGGNDPAGEARRLADDLSKGQTGNGKYGDLLVSYSPIHIGRYNWSVVVSTPEPQVVMPIKKNYYVTIAYIVLVLLLLYAAGFWTLRTNIKATQLENEKMHLEEKVALQDELRASRDHLDTILKTMPSGLFTIGLDKTINSWNETAEKITGYTSEDVIGKGCYFLGLSTCKNSCGLLNENITKPIIGVECTIRNKSGQDIPITKNVDYMRDASGAIIGGIEIFVDITETKKAEEARINSIALEKEVAQLRRMDEVKTNFLSMVSHELRTPLSVILGNVTLALRGRFGGVEPPLRVRLETVQKRANQLNMLIENLLNLSRLEAGKLEIHKEVVQVADCVEEALSALSEEVRRKKIVATVELDPRASTVFADRNTFLQVLINLLNNAVKFTPDGGGISVRTALYREYVEIRIKDTGVGIPEKDLEHVFDRFYQVDNSPTRSYGGTGLGLSIVKQIIELHKGEITMGSREGEGAEAVVRLPRPELSNALSPSAARADSVPDEQQAAPPVAPRTLLIVDDETDFIDFLCDAFEGSRFKVISAENGVQGLEILGSGRELPDLILLDLRMKDMDGFAFIEKVRSTPATSAIPIAVLSATVDEKHRMRAFSLGANDFITKPVTQDDLLKRVNDIVG